MVEYDKGAKQIDQAVHLFFFSLPLDKPVVWGSRYFEGIVFGFSNVQTYCSFLSFFSRRCRPSFSPPVDAFDD